MEQIEFKDLKRKGILLQGKNSTIVLLENGDVAKFVHPWLLNIFGIPELLERKALLADQYRNESYLLPPKAIIYKQGMYVGTVMNPQFDKCITEYYFDLPIDKISDINVPTNLFLEIDKTVKKGNKRGIVFPDLCTLDNIIVTNNGIKFIDYDGIQVKDSRVCGISSNLGDQKQYFVPKYYNFSTKLFSQELDKKSLVVIYFQLVLGYNLEAAIEQYRLKYNDSTDQALERVFDELNLHDYDFSQKVSNLYKNNKKNEFIVEDAVRIAENYTMSVEVIKQEAGIQYEKKFFKK